MNITIHRGANQIGGCITEISTDGCKILVDFGSNLPGSRKEELTEPQVREITGDADAIFYTHFHGDHVGLCHLIPQEVPQYIGEGAKEVMLCKYNALKKHGDYSRQIEATERMQTYQAGTHIDVSNKGKIYVTPYFVCHSAFDAYMFLIECEGKRILHTGDFRRHGYLGNKLFKMLRYYIGKADILITEGTMLGRSDERVVPENSIKNNVIDILRKHKYVYALCSSTDLERLASFHAACKATGRVFFVDRYQKSVLDVFTAIAGSKSDLFKFEPFTMTDYKAANVKRKLQRQGFLIPVRASSEGIIRGLTDVYNDEEPWLIYSMWGGYAEPGKDYTIDSVIGIRELFGDRIFDGTKDGVHTSGHADVETLQEVCSIVSPRIGVIPIHKEEATKYESLPKVSQFKIFTEGVTSTDGVTITVK